MKRFLFAAILVASLCLGGTAEAKHPRVKYIQPRIGAYNGVTYVNPSFRAPSFGVYRGIPYSVPGYYGGYRGGFGGSSYRGFGYGSGVHGYVRVGGIGIGF